MVPSVIKKFSKTLPHFPDGRIDYSNFDEAPVVTVFVKFKDKILLLKRSGKVRTYQGLWNTVAGYLDELKSLEQKVREELNEEVGIGEEEVLDIKFGKMYKFKDKKITKTWIVYPCLVELKSKPQIKLDFEHTEYIWINKKKIKNFDTVPNLEESLKRVYE